jgi:multiphosphoryl transfer protein
MKQIEVTIQNQTGLHARPAKNLVNLAKQYKADIRIQHGTKRANAKSMVSVLTLGAVKGSLVIVTADGEDEEIAISEIETAILEGLGDSVDTTESHPEPIVKPVMVQQEKPGLIDQKDSINLIQGIPAAPGIAYGPAFQFRRNEIKIDEFVSLPGDGKEILTDAILKAKDQLAGLHQQMLVKNLGSEAAIFEAHIELLEDPDLLEGVRLQLENGQNIIHAWRETIENRSAEIAAINDSTLSARADDLRDVGRRVLQLMLGITDKGVTLPDTPVVVLASDLSPSETVMFDSERVLGFGLVNGGPTSHIAILARALGIPAVVGSDESILSLDDQTLIILNGNDGTLTINPAPEVIQNAEQVRNVWLKKREKAHQQAALPAVTIDGHVVSVTANAGSVADAKKAVGMGADGIGLLRTEFLFLERNTPPTEMEQYEVYRAIIQEMGSLPVILRTLDIGGDKPLPYIQMKPELNPFLGERGIRLCLNRPELFLDQLRAALRSAHSGNLRLMFPMVSDVSEIRQARVIIEELQQELGVPAIEIGIMVEVPSAALMADVIAPEIDFFSIGTNDLTQYTLAMDRVHPALAAKHDGLHPAVLRLIAQTITAAHKFGKRADLCGELGSDPQAIPILVGLGMDELSVSIPSIPLVKAQVRTLKMVEIQPLAQEALACSTAQEVRELVKKYLNLQSR